MNRKLLCLSLVIVCLFALSLQAEVPQRTSYQGYLTDNSNNPLNGSYDLTFKIYDDSIGSNILYEETHTGVPVVEGLFSVLIGGLSFVGPYDDYLFAEPDRFLGIQVGADPELAPRTRLTTAPYSFRTGTVDGASGGTVSSDLTVEGTVHSTSGGVQFPDNSVQTTASYGTPIPRTSWMSPYWRDATNVDLYTEVVVYNPSGVATDVTVSFYSFDGSFISDCTNNLSAGAVWQMGSSTAPIGACATGDGYGHLTVTATQPVAVTGALYKFNETTIFDMGVALTFYAQ